MALQAVLQEFDISSESSDSDLEETFDFFFENDERCFCNLCWTRIPRIQDFMEQVIDQYNEKQFQMNFRY